MALCPMESYFNTGGRRPMNLKSPSISHSVPAIRTPPRPLGTPPLKGWGVAAPSFCITPTA